MALVDGLVDAATRHRVALVGGNVTRSPGPLIVDVTLTGSAKRRKVLTRGGGRPVTRSSSLGVWALPRRVSPGFRRTGRQ